MAQRPRTHTDTVEDTAEEKRSAAEVIAIIVGALGVVAAFIPGLWWFAWILAVVAIAIALPAVRQGPTGPSYRLSRIAVGAGIVALIIGLLNLGITQDWFEYFNVDADT